MAASPELDWTGSKWALAGSSGSSEGDWLEARLRNRVKTAGRTRSVATVASAMPPITARASGAFCSLPSSNPSDIGIMPAIMAQPVMMMGRSLPLAAVMAARSAGMPLFAAMAVGES